MASLPIEVIDLRLDKNDLLAQCLHKINETQTEFSFLMMASEVASEFDLLVHNETNIADFLEAAESKVKSWRGFHPFLIYIFDSPIAFEGIGNLFSVNASDAGCAVITTHNVPAVLIPRDRIHSYIIYQLAAYALKLAGGNIDFHNEDRGCMFDYREKKKGIVKAIKTGHICDPCKKQLATSPLVSTNQFRAVQSLLKISSYALEYSVTKPTKKPKIFVASSVEGLAIARAIQADLEREHEVEIWSQSAVFGLGNATLEALESAVLAYSFAVFIFTPDDKITSRGKKKSAARDNVIFEAGLFIGKLGRFKAFIVKPRDLNLQMPSDLSGITTADYDPTKENISAMVGPACSKIRSAIQRLES